MAKRLRRWDIYWALSIFFWIVGLTFAVLEALGVFKDIGIVGTMVGLVLALYFGFTAATGSSVTALQDDVVGVRSEVRTIGIVLERMEQGFVRMEQGFARMEQGFVRMEQGFARMEQRLGRMEQGLGNGLARIERVLIERLPGRS